MDRWEATIEEYQKSQTLDTINAVLHTAEGILKEDLAPFEWDWFVQTLLSQPVCLLDVISARLNDDAWTKIMKDAYKLLSSLIESRCEGIEQYIDAIVMECQKPQEPRTRSHALQCLASCVKQSMSGATASQYIDELAPSSTCKRPLALLVGTICEYHPEVVTEQYIRIWRTYLNLLGCNKNTDQVCKALLTGVGCLFKNFGSDIPLMELSQFYDQLTRELINNCESTVLAILRDYSPLFKEKIAEDAALRAQLWACEDLSPLVPVYREIASVLDDERLQTILQTEVIPRTDGYAKQKFTALRICTLYQKHGVCVGNVGNIDVYALEFELRSEVSYDTAEAVHWCIESNVANSEKLLQTAILFYDNLPASKRRGIVVDCFLNAPPDVFNTTLNFLTTQSCRDDASLSTFLPLWRDIFDSQHFDKRNTLFEKYMDNLLLVLDNFLEDGDDDKKLPEKLSNLLSLTSHILSLQPAEDTCYQCELVPSKLVELTRACGPVAAVVAVAAACLPRADVDGLSCIFQMIRVDTCKDERLLCELCLALIQPPDTAEPDVVLKALEIIFTRKDAEPKTLSQGIKKLEQLIVKENNNLDKSTVSKIMQQIEKLKWKKDLIGKDGRILQRAATEFLGKYWNTFDYNQSVNSEDNALLVHLKDVLTLDVPNPIDGNVYKIKLSRLLQLAIIYEQEDALRMLINVICANLRSNKSPLLQKALGRAIVSLCRATVGATRQKVALDAATFCDVDATMYILQEITVEMSPAVRRSLSDVVKGILLKDQGTEANELMLRAVYKEACCMMEHDNSIIKLGGLDITTSLLTALKANRQLSREMLPKLMLLIAKTHEQSNEVFEQASTLYIDIIALFDNTDIDSTVEELIKTCVNATFEITNDIKAKIFKDTLKSILIFAGKLERCSIIQRAFLNSYSAKYVYLWSEIPKRFDVKDGLADEILCDNNCYVLESVLFETDLRNGFALEAHLRFLNQYAAVLLKSYSTQTLKHISNIIENIQPENVIIHRKLLSELLTHMRQILHSTRGMVLKSFEIWSECIPVKDITEHLEKEKFLPEHAVSVKSLRIMTDIFKLQDPTSVLTTVSIFAKTWSRTLLKIYASGHIRYLKKEVPYLKDLLSLSLRFLPLTDVKNTILEGYGMPGANENAGMEFCRFFISVYVKYLLKKPFLLSQNDMSGCWIMLNDIVKWTVRERWRDDQMECVLELVDQLWPTYKSKASFTNIHALLLDLSCVNRELYARSVASQHAAAIVRDATRCEDRIAIVPLLPGGEGCSECYRRFSSDLLPTRLSDLSAASSAALRALLDALAATADVTLLEIVVTLLQGDDTPGWWDDALTYCMSSLATTSSSTSLLMSVETRARHSPSVCRRILLPLIRYSPTAICEKFFASILKELLETLGSKIKAPSKHPQYAACVQQRTIVLDILQLLFEKIPSSIESPSSPLYKHVSTDKQWHVAGEVIRHCYKLRDKLVSPEGATPELLGICREFQYAAFKSMCVCLCVRQPKAKTYTTVLEAGVWRALVDEGTTYHLPLTTEWNQRKVSACVSVPARAGARRRSRSLSQSRVFLRTLSENPLEFDLLDPTDEEEEETEVVQLPANSLSGHPVSGTLTALLEHVSAMSDSYEPLSALCRLLENAGRNAAWLLAQAVCNNKDLFKQHANALRPALLAALVNTSDGDLNSLHVDILNTLVLWKDDIELTEPAISHLNTCINRLFHTALRNANRPSIFRMLEEVLESSTRVYGSYVRGDVDVEAIFDDQNKTKFKACLKLLLRFAKNGVRVRNLLTILLAKLEANYKTELYRAEMPILAELMGVEMSNCNEQEKISAACELKKILDEVKKHNISDYVKFLHASGCCDLQQFKTTVDTALKLPESDRKRCLRIISGYIAQHPASPEVADIPPDIRQMADRISGDRCFEDLFKTSESLQPPAKRARVAVSSPILGTIGRRERALSDALAQLGREREDKACGRMSRDDLPTRFVECFYIAVYLPLKYSSDKPDLTACLAAFLKMLFRHLGTLDSFRSKKLRDQPWVVEHPIELTRTRGNVGTLRSYSYADHVNVYDDEESTGVNVQASIQSVLDTFLQFATVTTEAGLELTVQLLRCLGRGFESRPVLARLLSSLLEVAPQIVVIARECVDQLCGIDGFIDTIERLNKSTLGTEGEQVFRLLREEIALQIPSLDLFVLGNSPTEDILMTEKKEFSIEELESAFQKLSNWDELRIQERRQIENQLPVLWTDRITFKELLTEELEDTNGWFGKMVCLYHDNRKDLLKWLRALDRWPRRHYASSAVMEAMQWHSLQQQEFDIDKLQLSAVIPRDDCLVEWAARLMLRNAYLIDKCDTDATKKLSRSHELSYCERANEMGLHNLALSVIERNCHELEEDETLQWLQQKMLATAANGLKLNDKSDLEKAMNMSKYFPDYYKYSTADVVIGVNMLKMKLEFELKSLTPPIIEDTMQLVRTRLNERVVTSHKNRKNLEKLYETAVLYYDGIWDENAENKEDVLLKLSEYLDRFTVASLDVAGVAAIVLNRIDACETISDASATFILAKLKPVIATLPDCFMDQLKAKLSLFPAQIVRSSGIQQLQEEAKLDKYKQRLQLLGDADYLLLQYCEELLKSLSDDGTSKFDDIFTRMQSRIFENPYAGSDYQALVSYKELLDSVKTAAPNMRRKVLKDVIKELRVKQPRAVVRLAHVCRWDSTVPDEALDRLLRLPQGEQVVGVSEELHIFTGSVRRPCVVTVLTSSGRKRRYLLKNEDLRRDAAAQCLKRGNAGYSVIPLGEDCGLIEFLEDHKTVRDLIASRCDVDIRSVRQAAKDEELILSPRSSSVQNYNELCSKIPAYSLRSAIEEFSSSVQDFITKKRRFLETLADVTITSWLFGLGDRHLENLLYSVQDGGVVCIDWGAILQYGGAELPPARLTRNMLAVCDTKVLESKLQALLSSLRESNRFILPILKLSFKWMDNFDEKLIYIQGILQGRTVAHNITKDSIQKSTKAHKSKYIELLDIVFSEHEDKDDYSVEEQVSSLLLHCTDPWILSVTRSGWEPWL